MPSVGWDGRDVSGLSHEQIHRWTRDGASPEALAAARDRHLARADELRGAADRLQTAQRGVGETWAGRDADAAGNRTRVLAQRMEQLAETVGGQARGLDGMRTALVRVQAAVGPPRLPALPALGVPPVLDELRALVTGRPADGYGAFRTAAADQAAAREAYRAYLGETAGAARAVGPAGAGPAPAPDVAPTAGPGRAPLPAGARGAASGVLQQAAGPVRTTGPGAVPTTGPGLRPATGGPQVVPARAVGVVPTGSPVGGPGFGAGPGSSGGPGSGGAAVSGGAPASGGVAATGAAPAGAGPGAGSAAGPAAATGGPAGAGGGVGASIVGPPARSGAGPRGAGPGLPTGGPVVGAEATRRPDGRERAPSAVGGPAGPPRVLDDHRSGDFGPDATPPAADGPEVPDPEQPVVPVRHVSWLVDPDPAGWGAPGRRVVPPVLGEGP